MVYVFRFKGFAVNCLNTTKVLLTGHKSTKQIQSQCFNISVKLRNFCTLVGSIMGYCLKEVQMRRILRTCKVLIDKSEIYRESQSLAPRGSAE